MGTNYKKTVEVKEHETRGRCWVDLAYGTYFNFLKRSTGVHFLGANGFFFFTCLIVNVNYSITFGVQKI